ncbi:hypothetical protein M422DRAFT_267191 [Sphaerobolus stellatus SS14]|uniref:cystathionine gamma-lyase n=1 Tax=Sphaerobolus stellatus (strain SS14) TaxID=990650 RepID=A0A0C9V114_SPHS4|nr:hypothetical protein M422DRAFT_267191 [Sphaerobolus stellatus SS14]
MTVKLSFKGVGSGASENEAQKETAEKIEALQAQKRQFLGGEKWNLHISQCGIRTPIVVSSIASSASKENDLFLLAGIFTSASISQNSSTMSQVKLDLWRRDAKTVANLKTVDEAAANDVDSELRPPLDATSKISLLGPSCFDSLSTPCIWMSFLRLNHDVLERMISGLETTGEKVSAFASGTDLDRNPHKHHPPPFPNRTHNLPNLLSPAASRPLIVIDSTFLSPFYVSPLAEPISTDLAIHSVTKYINRHSDVLMGAVILPNASTAEANGNIKRKYPPLSSFLITVLFRL